MEPLVCTPRPSALGHRLPLTTVCDKNGHRGIPASSGPALASSPSCFSALEACGEHTALEASLRFSRIPPSLTPGSRLCSMCLAAPVSPSLPLPRAAEVCASLVFQDLGVAQGSGQSRPLQAGFGSRPRRLRAGWGELSPRCGPACLPGVLCQGLGPEALMITKDHSASVNCANISLGTCKEAGG